MDFKIDYKKYSVILMILATIVSILYELFVSNHPRAIRVAYRFVIAIGLMIWYFFHDGAYFNSLVIIVVALAIGAIIFLSRVLYFLDPSTVGYVFLAYFVGFIIVVVYVMKNYLEGQEQNYK